MSNQISNANVTFPEYTLDDISADARNLHRLLDVIVTLAVEEDPQSRPGEGFRPAMERINSLLWIARDCAQRIDTQIERDYTQLISAVTGASVMELTKASNDIHASGQRCVGGMMAGEKRG